MFCFIANFYANLVFDLSIPIIELNVSHHYINYLVIIDAFYVNLVNCSNFV